MPSTYAHYRMGQEVRSCLGEKEKKIVETYPELFSIGLHGPDILFYYHPIIKNEVKKIGSEMHEKSGKDFFQAAAKVVNATKEKEAYLAYLYGFICHFALDVTCHGYIGEKEAASGLSHSEIETEFDRMLMVADGLDPIRKKLTDHIVPSMENAEIIQAFFDGVDSAHVKMALDGMITCHNILLAPSKSKRFVIGTLMRLAGCYEKLHGLMVNFEKNPQCEDSTEKLGILYTKAKELAIQLIPEYQDYLDGKGKLNPIYDYNFGSQLIEKERKER
ncbi:MAG: zinc dependent phospholipase C family protein [Lachnospiraceae bacterium]